MTLLAALAAGWVALLLAAPWLPTAAASVVYLLGAHVCHQLAERSWHLDGVQLPVCARCLGIYAGAAVALVCARGAGAHHRGMLLGAILLNAATIAIEWATVWPVSNAMRAAAGAALGIAAALAIRHVFDGPAREGGTVDYERWPSRRRITSALPHSRI